MNNMNLQNSPWYVQMGIFLLIGAIAVVLFYVFYYKDNNDIITGLDSQIEGLKEEIRKAKKKESEKKQIQEQTKNLEKFMEDLKDVLPEDKEIQQISNKGQAAVSSARLRIMNWVTQPDRRKDPLTEIPISIMVQGNYHNLALFFDQLSRLKKIFTVDNLSITQLGNEKNAIYTVNANFTASTYLYKDKKK